MNRLILSSKSTGVNSGAPGFDRLSTMSGTNYTRTRSVYSSSSQSTVGMNSLRRTVSQQSLNSTEPGSGHQNRRPSIAPCEEEDTVGEFGDGNGASDESLWKLGERAYRVVGEGLVRRESGRRMECSYYCRRLEVTRSPPRENGRFFRSLRALST